MIRICYCISHFEPVASGAERQARLQGAELVRRGHVVHVVTRAVAGEPDEAGIDGIRVHRQIRPREFGPLFGLTFLTNLASALKRLRDEYDIVHCHQGLWEAAAAGWVAPRLGKPSLVQPAAGGDFGEVQQLKRTRGRSVLRRLILRNLHFVAISEQIERELDELGVPASRRTRLASGVDSNAFRPGPSAVEHEMPPRPRVLFLGRLHAQKNLAMLLDTWPHVRRRVSAHLILAGDGPDRDGLAARAAALGVADSVHFVGHVARPAEYLRAADVFVLPSVAEGMSNSLLQAMAVGLPIAASRIGGNTDLLVDCVSGRLIEPNSVSAWSAGLIELLTEGELARQLGAAARQRVVQDFSIQRVVDRYVALYEQLLAK
jgi:glycosyltransferase involved in cell wall biosynthesis